MNTHAIRHEVHAVSVIATEATPCIASRYIAVRAPTASPRQTVSLSIHLAGLPAGGATRSARTTTEVETR